MKKTQFVFLFILIFNSTICSAQDATYNTFLQSKMLYNPSLVGSDGAQSWKIRSKAQWLGDGAGYRSASVLFEETVPCSIIDIGGKFNFNQEGDGGFQTYEFGFLSAIYAPFSAGESEHNFRMGADFGWGINRLDFSKLVWSDQLDPKYGVVRASGFGAEGVNYSKVYFNPGVGISLRSLINKSSSKAWLLNIGVAAYRLVSIYNVRVNQSASVLGLNKININRVNGFVSSKFVLRQARGELMVMEPFLVYQQQGEIGYIEGGARYGYLSNAGITGSFHRSTIGSNTTAWASYTADFSFVSGRTNRSDIFFTYSHNVSGLQNFVGPQFEVGLNIHFRRSSVCKLLDKDDEIPYNSEFICPIMTISPGKRKMYEQIWFKN